jgi:2-C-methyl-D-erythritol 4-phosphate cytidylyltransferase
LSEKQSGNKFWVIIPAAGLGSRLGANLPKQYLKIGHKTILEHAVSPFIHHPQISKVIIALHPEDSYWQQLQFPQQAIETVPGGSTRAASVWAGLRYLKSYAKEKDWVLVHDAARPMLTAEEISALIAKIADHPVGGIYGLPVADTLKFVEDGEIKTTISRENIWRAQTPQMFRYQILYEAMENVLAENDNVTDEASAVERMGLNAMIIAGNPQNIKITTTADFSLAKILMTSACNE